MHHLPCKYINQLVWLAAFLPWNYVKNSALN